MADLTARQTKPDIPAQFAKFHNPVRVHSINETCLWIGKEEDQEMHIALSADEVFPAYAHVGGSQVRAGMLPKATPSCLATRREIWLF